MGFLRYDSPIMRLLSKMADILWVNILVLLCSLPIFTIGASLTAMQSIFYRLLHNEDSYVTKEFFHSFKINFKQATLVWLILLPIMGFLVYDFFFLRDSTSDMEIFMRMAAVILFVLVFIVMLYVFPIISRYENTTKETLKNACVIAITHPLQSILMLLIFAFCIYVEMIMPYKFYPLLFCFGIAAPWYFCSMVYMPIFDKLDGIDPKHIAKDDEE